MYRFLLILTLLNSGFMSTAWSQNRTADSITYVLEKTTGKARYPLHIALARSLVGTDYNRALIAASEGHEVALAFGDSSQIVESGRIMGQLYNYLNRTPDAIDILEKVLPVAERNNCREDLIKIYDNLGIGYAYDARYDLALNFHFKALALTDKRASPDIKATVLFNIGNVELMMKRYDDALAHYLEAVKIMEDNNDMYDRERYYLSIALTYNTLQKYDLAVKYFQKSANACGDNCHELFMMSLNQGFAAARFGQKDYKSTREYLAKVMDVAEKGNYNANMLDAKFWLARVEFREGNEQAGRDLLLDVIRMGNAEKRRFIVLHAYDDMAASFDRAEDSKNAAVYLKRYIALKDSIYNNEMIDNIARTKSEFGQRENLEIIRAKEMTISQQRRFNYAVVVIALMAVSFGIFLYRNNRAMRGMNTKLKEAQDLIFAQNRKLEVRNRELDNMVEKKTEELKLVNLSLRQMNSELDTFISRTAEDIRAPLASLKGICNVALMDIRDRAPLVYLEKIDSTAELLNSILKRLLAINRINQSRITVSEINLRALVDSVLAVQQKKGLPPDLVIRRNIEKSLSVSTDRELLTVVLENAVEKAIRFCSSSTRGGHFIEIDAKSSANGRIRILIVDNGVVVNNVSLDELDEIFMNNHAGQTETAERKDLYFVKTAAKKIGGKVELRRTDEGLNEFTITL